jgi:hypothetical protein
LDIGAGDDLGSFEREDGKVGGSGAAGAAEGDPAF